MGRNRRQVIVLGPDAALRVRNGALDIEHGPSAERIRLKVDIDDDTPCAILFDGRGEFMTGEAVRWCTRRGIGLVLPDGPGCMVTIAHSALEASDGETLRDVGPAIIRAQRAADPAQVAREIVRAKISEDAKGIGPRLTVRGFDVARYEAKLAAARSVAEIMVIEAKAVAAYWRSHRDLGLVERRGGNLPRTWLRFANRGKGAEFLGNKHASHPISAMINYCVVVEAGRLARALAGEGMALQSASCTETSTAATLSFGTASNHCGRRSTRVCLHSSPSTNSAGETFRQAGSTFIASRGRSLPNFCRNAFCRSKTFSTQPRG